MLHDNSVKVGRLARQGFLVWVELEEGGATSVMAIENRLAEGLQWLEGVGKVNVEHLGEIEKGEDE